MRDKTGRHEVRVRRENKSGIRSTVVLKQKIPPPYGIEATLEVVRCNDSDSMQVDSQLDCTCRRSLFPIHNNRVPTVNTHSRSGRLLEQ
jgi:hypothetical protein